MTKVKVALLSKHDVTRHCSESIGRTNIPSRRTDWNYEGMTPSFRYIFRKITAFSHWT
jgi:hypothetical protein